MLTIHIGLNPVFAHLGPLALSWHGLLTTLALFVALWIASRGAARAGLDADAVSSVMLWAVVGGLVGARAFYYLDHLPALREHPENVLALWKGGIAVYGSFLGGIAAGWWRARRLGLPAWTLLDIAMPALLVGQAIGRVGCFLNGDAWGGPTGRPWGVVYTHPDALLPAGLHNVPTHPYPLYEIAWDLAVLAVALALGSRLRRKGDRFLVAAIGYGLGRLVLSSVRQEPEVLFGLQEAQVVALVTMAVAVALLLRPRHRSGAAGHEPSAPAPPRDSRSNVLP
jgi:phosphatidylglycerol:prolipoprotein diacylglycerol transferase